MALTTAAVVLAGGAGTRFTGPSHKLVAPLRGRRVLDLALDAPREAAARGVFDEVIVVLGALSPEDADLPEDVTVVANEAWADGQAGSLRVGVAVASAHGHGAVVVGLADQPLVPVEAWIAVAAARSHPVAVAEFAGRRQPPVRLEQSVWSLLPASGDEGARALMRLRPELVVAVACTGDPGDVDTVEDLRQWS